ncbi:dTDP-4-dehydrorhamnose reductase [Deinococcus aerius]|uniref:dTDP-4-dehydrorhamnose reductase n=1 Tax=Deinococcus aerius TaxID=200253 RepID=A0A2I9DU59_9DEIO|nr:family 1 glycosylhydrolase [Deinococcus aerius]GBF06237.1 dTDP-4-dehydrorhamnose reductase [Deinococcus aerius]
MRPLDRLELWVGVEPTVSRIGDSVQDQLVLSGFHERLEDIDRLASLGATRVRFPVLWERTAPNGLEQADWTWPDTRLARLAECGLDPIVGLVHHGGGPLHTHLLDPAFVTGLTAYARAVAERYPHVRTYTPVNEPLTTARFSALYGHWYPHARDDHSFWRALMHQLQATVLAMRAIREVNPEAELLQTEDMGLVSARPSLREQADFENERRWLSFDLLLGRVDQQHPMWSYLRWAGATEREILWFAENPCPPDVLGLNAYVTSERFLDDRVEHYRGGHHGGFHGGNGRRAYVDIEAVRVQGHPIGGPCGRLYEAGARYGLPLALTEVHLACTREEQLRWLHETWQQAQSARADGVDVRAVTAWSALGAFDWNSLLTRQVGHYESGLWDVRAPQPRPTALAHLARHLATGAELGPARAVLEGPGWWRRADRLRFPPEGPLHAEAPDGPPLLVAVPGRLGGRLLEACGGRGLPARRLAPGEARPALEAERPWAVVVAAGAFPDPADLRALAAACAGRGLPLLLLSSAQVFGGDATRPFLESDAPRPTCARGVRQRLEEEAVLAAHPGALVIRTGPLFDVGETEGFAAGLLRALRAGRPFPALAGVAVSPTFLPDLLHHALDLLLDGEVGVWHLANAGAVSWFEFAGMLARAARLDPRRVRAVSPAQVRSPAPWPALASERGWLMPGLEDAVRRWSPVPAVRRPRPADTRAPEYAGGRR